jgi:hypothetical protein
VRLYVFLISHIGITNHSKPAGILDASVSGIIADEARFDRRMKRLKKFVAVMTALVSVFGGLISVMPVEPVHAAGISMMLKDYNGSTVPTNLAGDTYPSFYDFGGVSSSITLNGSDAITGKSLQAVLNSGVDAQIQFNPYSTTARGYARDYSANPAGWQFNTYNRLRFWLKAPAGQNPFDTTFATYNYEIGTYVKSVTTNDPNSDENGTPFARRQK